MSAIVHKERKMIQMYILISQCLVSYMYRLVSGSQKACRC